jgi:hypothetical protein
MCVFFAVSLVIIIKQSRDIEIDIVGSFFSILLYGVFIVYVRVFYSFLGHHIKQSRDIETMYIVGSLRSWLALAPSN